MLADFYVLRRSNGMKIAIQKNHLGGTILYRSLDPSKKRRLYILVPKILCRTSRFFLIIFHFYNHVNNLNFILNPLNYLSPSGRVSRLNRAIKIRSTQNELLTRRNRMDKNYIYR